MKYIKLVFIAIIVGSINGMFSTGAGLVLVPSLIYTFKQDEYMARGTTILVLLSLTIVNILIYSTIEKFTIDIIYILIGGILGNIIGNKIIYKINRHILSFMFAIFTIVMGIGMIK